jgi:hypothetical protein
MEDLKNMQGYLKRIHRGILEMSPHSPRRIAAYAALIATIVAVVACGDFESTKSLAPTAAQAISPSQTAQPIPTTVTPTTEPLTTEPPPPTPTTGPTVTQPAATPTPLSATPTPVPISTPLPLPTANAPSEPPGVPSIKVHGSVFT